MRTPGEAIRRLLVMAAVAILALYTVVQAINRPVAGDKETYSAEFSDVFGLRANSDVRVRGVQVGKVVDIELQPTGTALVTFTVASDERLTEDDRLAIRFQNLVGQRYLGIVGAQEDVPGADRTSGDQRHKGALLNPDTVIPVAKTSGSFDITALFNGLRPILQGADPAVFNKFAQNMIDLLQGDGGVGIGDVLGDVERLTDFATNKNLMIRTIINNLGVIADQLQGKSAIINALMENMGMLFDTLEVNLELLKGAFGQGAKVFPPIVEVMKHAFDLSLGGHDHVRARLMELIPDTDQLAEIMKIVPTMLANLNAQMTKWGVPQACSKGEVALPVVGEVLLGAGKVKLCKG
ncbi:MAG TPA: MlaD family protein [Gordonia sp. (in: high G+C Gram-positive bacteria)]|uniref:MlaD family protein n=1 Tax=unclassified Gordonia (in: high G+C Gram-positive bacteria) TaxID=2657482 RepID=UPI0025C185D8|nr:MULTISPECIES: MlaD family protein [unclassified Gordonia (in: high G+C Gram-positive bacteria)]HNP55831.1 MlaD family protein [Gordonia sp. (in: high G+C Gram-positive bacteria)]HRC50946.1 MlaD family protein [Gordonia sp. (in: high G+C Gram-positive bacteria)]